MEISEQDRHDLLAIARKKKINISQYPDVKTSSARINMILADEHLKQAVSIHHEYEDATGKRGSSPKGFMIQINKRIKRMVGKSITNIENHEAMNSIALLKDIIPTVIRNGEALSESRENIKETTYNFIDSVMMHLTPDIYNRDQTGHIQTSEKS